MILNLEQSNLMDLNYKPSLECKKLLNKYNKIINIRDDYEKYVIAATTYLNNYDFSASITYIENLFDYKEPSKINQELEEKYKQKIEYKHENCETISYTIYKKNLFNTRQIDLAIFNLLRKNWITLDENIKTVIVEFKLKEEYYKKEFPKELITEKYVIMLYLNKIIRYRYRKDGSEDETFILKNIK